MLAVRCGTHAHATAWSCAQQGNALEHNGVPPSPLGLDAQRVQTLRTSKPIIIHAERKSATCPDFRTMLQNVARAGLTSAFSTFTSMPERFNGAPSAFQHHSTGTRHLSDFLVNTAAPSEYVTQRPHTQKKGNYHKSLCRLSARKKTKDSHAAPRS